MILLGYFLIGLLCAIVSKKIKNIDDGFSSSFILFLWPFFVITLFIALFVWLCVMFDELLDRLVK